MFGSHKVPAQIEKVQHLRMGRDKPLGLLHRLESPHTPLSNPGSLVRLLCSIILILLSAVDRFAANGDTPLGK